MDNVNDWRRPENQEALWAGYEHALEQMQKIFPEKIEEWHHKVIYSITQSGLHTLRQLRQAWPEEDLSRLAWAARNAMELEYWLEYVTCAKANAYRFYLDWLNDTSSLLRSAAATEETKSESKSDSASSFEFPYPDMDFGGYTVAETTKFLDDQRSQHPEFPTKYLRIREVVRGLGKETQFDAANSLFSKHIHPTAYSILSYPTPRLRYNLSVIMLVNGCLSLVRLLGTLDIFLKATGLPEVFGDTEESK